MRYKTNLNRVLQRISRVVLDLGFVFGQLWVMHEVAIEDEAGKGRVGRNDGQYVVKPPPFSIEDGKFMNTPDDNAKHPEDVSTGADQPIQLAGSILGA